MSPKVVGIDLYEREDPESEVQYGICATQYPFERHHTVLVARPDHSGWHYEVFMSALQTGATMVYVGLPKNFEKDLFECDFEIFIEEAGQDGEKACLIKNCQY